MASNDLAKTLKDLHVPSQPLILANVWDVPSLKALVSLNTGDAQPVKAVATASWAIAACLGLKDDELTMEQNLVAIRKIIPFVTKAGLPLTVDLQDGYGGYIQWVVTEAVEAGAVGANIEDGLPPNEFSQDISGSLYTKDDQVRRLKSALKAAKDAGCPDFVLNARCDIFIPGYSSSSSDDDARMEEAIERGKAYLEAGATTVFYWGGPERGLRDAEVEKLIKELDGKVAVKMAQGPEALSTRELGNKGVARISVGPSLFKIAIEAMRTSALRILQGGLLGG